MTRRVPPGESRSSIWPPAFLSFALLATLVFVITSSAARTTAEKSDAFWASLQYEFLEAEHYSSLASMTAAADAVVVGRLTSIEAGRVWGDPPDDAAYYAEARLEVKEVVAGTLIDTGGALRFELFMAEPSVIEHLQANLPSEEAIYFLRNKGAEAMTLEMSRSEQAREAEYYRLVTMGAVLRNGPDGRTVTIPGRGEPFLVELAGRPFDAMLDQVRNSLIPDP